MFTFIDVIVFLFCFVSVTVLKYYDQKQEFILAYNSKEGVHSAQEGTGAHFICIWERGSGSGQCNESVNSQATAVTCSSSSASEPPQTMGPQTSCGPSVQTHKHMRDFSLKPPQLTAAGMLCCTTPYTALMGCLVEVVDNLDFVFNSTSYQLESPKTNSSLLGVEQ